MQRTLSILIVKGGMYVLAWIIRGNATRRKRRRSDYGAVSIK